MECSVEVDVMEGGVSHLLTVKMVSSTGTAMVKKGKCDVDRLGQGGGGHSHTHSYTQSVSRLLTVKMVSNTGTAMVKNISLSWPMAAAVIIIP